jgi:hypothetical protein
VRFTTFVLAFPLLNACRTDSGLKDLVSDVPSNRTSLGGVHRITAPGCDAPASGGAGHVVYRLPDGHLRRIEAKEGAVAEDLSLLLDRIGLGEDAFVNTSPDGEWLLVQTSRFGCGAQSCLAVVGRTVCQGEVIVADQGTLPSEGFSAIGNGGNLVVYPAQGGPHKVDLFAVSRKLATDAWGKPVLLTAGSPHVYHNQPTLSADGLTVLMDCGEEPAAVAGTDICEARTDGTGVSVIVPQKGPGGATPAANHHAAYAPDGSIVFEGTWNNGGEQVWREPRGHEPALVNGEIIDVNPTVWRFTDDNSPCVLPDGRIASLWLGRAGGKKGGHELKVMNPDGTAPVMVATEVDVVDVGIGCGK